MINHLCKEWILKKKIKMKNVIGNYSERYEKLKKSVWASVELKHGTIIHFINIL